MQNKMNILLSSRSISDRYAVLAALKAETAPIGYFIAWAFGLPLSLILALLLINGH